MAAAVVVVAGGIGAAWGLGLFSPPPPARADGELEDQPGKWRKLRPAARTDLTAAQQEQIAALEAIGYADGTRDVAAEKVITIHDRERAMPGWNLYNSGHEPEAYLMDMDGNVVHTWRQTFRVALPDSTVRAGAPGTHHWRRVRLGPGGDLYAIWEGWAMVRLNAKSEVVFAVENRAHHDLVLLPDDQLAVLTRKADLLPAFDANKPVLQDFIEIRGRDGALVRSVSLLEALLESGHGPLFEASRDKDGDITHTNSLVRLDGSFAHLRPEATAGRYLVSMRNLDAVGIVDLDLGKFVWLHRGEFKAQHDARLVAPGWLTVFDNRGLNGRSRVLAYDPTTMKVVWRYDDTPKHPLWSSTLGVAQRLDNGNWLISESDGGRAVEVTEGGETVWEMYNPHRAGEQKEYIAALFEVTRLPLDLDRSWVSP